MSTPIPADRLRALNSGDAAATHLAECLAVDFAALLQGVAPVLEPEALQRMRNASGKGITQRMALAARLLREAGQGDPSRWQAHASDTVRGWACYLIGSDAGAALPAKLRAMRSLADASVGAGSIALPAPLRLRSAAPTRRVVHAYRAVQAASRTRIADAGSNGQRPGALRAGLGRELAQRCRQDSTAVAA